MDTATWRAALSFTDRFVNISKIQRAVKQRDPSLDNVAAQVKAKDAEQQALSSAASRAEYDRLCDDAAHVEVALTIAPDELSPVGDLPVSPVPVTLGPYKHAVHYRDGLFSEVYKATNRAADGPSTVALKVTTPSMMVPPHDSEREARILADAKHANVVPLLETFQMAGGHYVLALEFMPLDLGLVLDSGRATQAQVKSSLRDMFCALAFLHSRGVIHRDVKPSNLLLKSHSGPAYLADFGIAWSPTDPASESAEQKITDVGTTAYRPPELLFGQRAYGCALDLWAAGCVVAEAASQHGETLFDAGDLGSELALIQSIFKSLGTPTLDTWPEAATLPDWGKMLFKDFPAQTWEQLLPRASPEARELVSQLVVYESGRRTGAEKALSSAYLSA